MRTTIIKCDRCGSVIEGYPVKIIAQHIDRETGDIWPAENEHLPSWAEQIEGKDFCESCTKEIVGYALGENDKQPEETIDMAQIDRLEEMVKGAEQKETKIDHGKIMALTKAGWPAAQIADEMGLSIQAVYNSRHKLKKEGRL